MIVPTGNQIRAARALLGMSMDEFEASTGVSRVTLRKIKASGSEQPKIGHGKIHRVQHVLEHAGIDFLFDGGRGVRLVLPEA